MTTPHDGVAPDPDRAQRDFIKGTIADGDTVHPGPEFARSSKAAGAEAGDGVDTDADAD